MSGAHGFPSNFYRRAVPDWITVVTHWRDQASYEAWSQARTPRSETVADAHELWSFDVVQASAAS